MWQEGRQWGEQLRNKGGIEKLQKESGLFGVFVFLQNILLIQFILSKVSPRSRIKRMLFVTEEWNK